MSTNLSSSVAAFVLGFSLTLCLRILLPSPDGATTTTAPGSSANTARWLGEHMLSYFLLVKLKIVRVRVCSGDNDPNISRHLKGKPLQPSLTP